MDNVIDFIANTFKVSESVAKEAAENFKFKIGDKLMDIYETFTWVGDSQIDFEKKIVHNKEQCVDSFLEIMNDDKSLADKIVKADDIAKAFSANINLLDPIEHGYISIDLIHGELIVFVDEKSFNSRIFKEKEIIEEYLSDFVKTCMVNEKQIFA